MHFHGDERNHRKKTPGATNLSPQLTPHLAFHDFIRSPVPASSLMPSCPSPLPSTCAPIYCLFLGIQFSPHHSIEKVNPSKLTGEGFLVRRIEPCANSFTRERAFFVMNFSRVEPKFLSSDAEFPGQPRPCSFPDYALAIKRGQIKAGIPNGHSSSAAKLISGAS